MGGKVMDKRFFGRGVVERWVVFLFWEKIIVIGGLNPTTSEAR